MQCQIQVLFWRTWLLFGNCSENERLTSEGIPQFNLSQELHEPRALELAVSCTFHANA